MSDPLTAYYAEIRAVEDGWWNDLPERRRVLSGSYWSSNLQMLRTIDAGHGVARDDPRVYSVAAYLRECEEIDADWARLAREQGWADFASLAEGPRVDLWKASVRRHVRKEDCDVRHFPGLIIGRPATIDTIPKLWMSVRTAEAVRPLVQRYFPEKGRPALLEPCLEEVYERLVALRLPWAFQPPFDNLTQAEVRIRLRWIATHLEEEDAGGFGRTTDQPGTGAAAPTDAAPTDPPIALRGANLSPPPVGGWTRPEPVATWTRVFGCSRNTIGRRFKKQQIPNEKVGNWFRVAIDALPERERSKHLPPATR